jgi:hypothetical protein
MAEMRHPIPSNALGQNAKRPPEQHDGRNGPRAPGAGRPKKDGSPAARRTPEERALLPRDGKPLAILQRGPPTDEEREAFRVRYGDLPDERLTPDEVWAEMNRPIADLDLEAAREVCERIAEGQTEVWLKRHWPGWPGQRTWRSWMTHPEVKALLRQCREYLSGQRLTAAEGLLAKTFEEVKKGDYDPKLAMAVMGGARFVAENSQRFAALHSPDRFGQQLNVQQTVKGSIEHGLTSESARLLDAVRATKRVAGPVIEGVAELEETI